MTVNLGVCAGVSRHENLHKATTFELLKCAITSPASGTSLR
jgi:hypothetical protein